MMCVPQHNTAQAFPVNAENEDQAQNYSQAVNGKRFCHRARHHAVWEGDGDVLGNEPVIIGRKHTNSFTIKFWLVRFVNPASFHLIWNTSPLSNSNKSLFCNHDV